MAEVTTIFDDTDEATDRAASLEANAQIEAGQGIPHEIVGEWLKKLANGEQGPPTFLQARSLLED